MARVRKMKTYHVRSSKYGTWAAYWGRVKIEGGMLSEADAWEAVDRHQNPKPLKRIVLTNWKKIWENEVKT